MAYNPSNGDTAVAQTKAGSVFVYLIAGASESNEYNIQTAPNPSPAFGASPPETPTSWPAPGRPG